MFNSPDTRASLLLSIRDPANQAAWDEFTEIYRPVICRLARMKGMQEADAEDLAQHVLLVVSRAIHEWEVDPQRARFRTWLQRVANNAILNALTRGVRERGAGGSDPEWLLQQVPQVDGGESDQLQTEYRRELFFRAARLVRSEFSQATWDAFWLTAVEGVEIDQAAERLGRTRGSVYASRSRVMKRLKDMVERDEDFKV